MTQEQFDALKQYERNFHCAVEAQWSPYPGRRGIELMLATWNEIHNGNRTVSLGCNSCVLTLITDVGKLYFEFKNAIPAPEPQEIEVPVVKVARKKRSKKSE